MSKPIETWAHAERDRQRALEAKMEKAGATFGWEMMDRHDTLAQHEAAMNAYHQREALAREQAMYGLGSMTRAIAGTGADGSTTTVTIYPTAARTGGYVGYDGAVLGGGIGAAVGMDRAPVSMISITTEHYETLCRGLKEAENKSVLLEAALAERDEIIDALVAEIADADALREENARLRIVNALKSKTASPAPSEPAWIEWHGSSSYPGELKPDTILDVKVSDDGGENEEIERHSCGIFFRWERIPGCRNITAYRIIL